MTYTLPPFGHQRLARRPFRDFLDSALVLRPTGTRTLDVGTGPARAVVADMFVLDGVHAHTLERDYLIFNTMVSGALTGSIGTGGVVVGRLSHVVRATSGRATLLLSPLNLLTDRELLVQAEDTAKALGWMA